MPPPEQLTSEPNFKFLCNLLTEIPIISAAWTSCRPSLQEHLPPRSKPPTWLSPTMYRIGRATPIRAAELSSLECSYATKGSSFCLPWVELFLGFWLVSLSRRHIALARHSRFSVSIKIS